jgi:large subunit ribosomal protein L23
MTLIKPVITEKSMLSARNGLYTFEVLLGANKSQVKVAVNSTFNVKVTSVNILRRHIPAKGTGSKRLLGNVSQAKFATVRLSKGQTIELFDLKEEK